MSDFNKFLLIILLAIMVIIGTMANVYYFVSNLPAIVLTGLTIGGVLQWILEIKVFYVIRYIVFHFVIKGLLKILAIVIKDLKMKY